MSLKVVHFFFILASIGLSLFFGAWCLQNYSWESEPWGLVLGFISLAGTGGLTYYLIHFLKKTKGFDLLGLLFLMGLLYSPSTWACSVCQFQTPDSPLVMAIREGIWILLFLVAAMVIGFLSLFLFWAKRDRQTTAK